MCTPKSSSTVNMRNQPDAKTLERLEILLNTVDPVRFDMVWKMVLECGEEERHFNSLQSAYRALASTWLLGMFAGVGFLLNSKLPEKNLFIWLLGAAVAIGIFSLAVLDLFVYHRLLLAAFEEAKQLELCLIWLPAIRHRMKGRKVHDIVRQTTALFYSLLALLALSVSLYGSYSLWNNIKYIGIQVACFALIVVVFWLSLGLVSPPNDERGASGAKT